MEEVTWAGRHVGRVFWKQWDLTVGLGLWVNSGEVQLSLVHGDEGVCLRSPSWEPGLDLQAQKCSGSLKAVLTAHPDRQGLAWLGTVGDNTRGLRAGETAVSRADVEDLAHQSPW